MLVQRGAVEAGQTIGVGREVGRHPVEDDSQSGGMALIDEPGEGFGWAEPGTGRELAERLVSPGAAERVFHDRQQFDVGESHAAGVRDQQRCQIVPVIYAHRGGWRPRPGMHLIDRDGRVLRMPCGATGDPFGVGPNCRCVVGDDGGCLRRNLGRPGHRVSLQREQGAVRPQYLKFVEGACSDAWDEQFPDARTVAFTHGMPAAVPVIEVADDRHALGVRSPQRRNAPRRYLPGQPGARPGSRQGRDAAPREQVDVHLAQIGGNE